VVDPGRLSTYWADLRGGRGAFSDDDIAAVEPDRMWLVAIRVENVVPPT